LAFVAAYLLLPALQAVNRFVFHPESFEPTIILILFWLYERARRSYRNAHLASTRAAWFAVGIGIVLPYFRGGDKPSARLVSDESLAGG
jgi:hypothetical protein